MSAAAGSAAAQTQAAPISLDLKAAIELAKKNDGDYQAFVTAAALAHQDRRQARAALLPTLSYLNEYLYTQSNGIGGVIFIANNAVHEYTSQGNVHEAISFASRGAYYQQVANEAAARARQEIATRGLVATVTQYYYAAVTAERKVANSAMSLRESRQFVSITTNQEKGGEVAHADVVKAQITEQQRERDLQEMTLAAEKAKIALAVILFPDFNQDFTLVDDLDQAPALASFDDVRLQASRNNPTIGAAEASLKAETYGLSSARGAYLPSFSIDYFYGIDASAFAVTGPFGENNVGSSVLAAINIPVWNWKATASRVEQARLRQTQAKRELNMAQRELVANLQAYYREAETAHAQIDSLRHSVNLATESVRLTVLRYQAGEATALEVTDAQTTLALARDAFDDGLNRYRVALAALQTLTGM